MLDDVKNKKLLLTSASLLVTSALLVVTMFAIRNNPNRNRSCTQAAKGSVLGREVPKDLESRRGAHLKTEALLLFGCLGGSSDFLSRLIATDSRADLGSTSCLIADSCSYPYFMQPLVRRGVCSMLKSGQLPCGANRMETSSKSSKANNLFLFVIHG